MKQTACILLFAVIALSCDNGYQTKYPYTIKDYSDSLQPYLLNALTLGLPGYDSAYHFLDKHASVEELKKLTLSEHPTLRMLALRALIYRKGIDHYPIIMDHFDDSAMVASDEGEWGIGMKTVTDFMLEKAGWESKEKRDEAADILLMQHNRFHCAFSILRTLDLDEKYRPSIQKMVQYDNHSYENETEYALYYLARFKNEEDIPLIKRVLKENYYWLESYSFRLMEEFPDVSYMEILEYYAKHTLWRDLRSLDHHRERPRYFYKALAVYKNKRAAELLAWLMKFIPVSNNCNSNIEDYCDDLYEEICSNSCEAYRDLIPLVEPNVMETLCNRASIQVDTSYKIVLDKEESKEKFNWFQ